LAPFKEPDDNLAELKIRPWVEKDKA